MANCRAEVHAEASEADIAPSERGTRRLFPPIDHLLEHSLALHHLPRLRPVVSGEKGRLKGASMCIPTAQALRSSDWPGQTGEGGWLAGSCRARARKAEKVAR